MIYTSYGFYYFSLEENGITSATKIKTETLVSTSGESRDTCPWNSLELQCKKPVTKLTGSSHPLEPPKLRLLGKSKHIWHPICHIEDSGNSRMVSEVYHFMNGTLGAQRSPLHTNPQGISEILFPGGMDVFLICIVLFLRDRIHCWITKHVYRPGWSGLESAPQ